MLWLRRLGWCMVALLLVGIVYGGSLIWGMSRSEGEIKMNFGFGNTYKVDDYKTEDLTNIETIEIITSSSDTSLSTSTGSKLEASLTGSITTFSPNPEPKLITSVSGNTLTIEEVRKSDVALYFSNTSLKLDITLPEDFSGSLVFTGSSSTLNAEPLALTNLDIKTSSGDIKLTKVELSGEFRAECSSGGIELDILSANRATLKTSSGDKKLGSIALTDDMNCLSSSGTSDVQALVCANANFESSSGDIRITQADTTGLLAQASSGSIKIKAFKGGARIKTSSGNVTLNCTALTDSLSLGAQSGTITLAFPNGGDFKLNATVNSGSIRNDFTLTESQSEERRLTGILGNGGTEVNLSTSSGDIRIKKSL